MMFRELHSAKMELPDVGYGPRVSNLAKIRIGNKGSQPTFAAYT